MDEVLFAAETASGGTIRLTSDGEGVRLTVGDGAAEAVLTLTRDECGLFAAHLDAVFQGDLRWARDTSPRCTWTAS